MIPRTVTPKFKPHSGKDYRVIKEPDHPLAMANGLVRVHRAVLYAKIGPGKHDCHWCKKQVEWMRGKSADMLVADHVNGIKSDNDPDNLVPSCVGCNALRKRGLRISEGEFFIRDHRGDRIRAVTKNCEWCGSSYVCSKSRDETRRFCSRECSGSYGRNLQMSLFKVSK